MKIKTNENYSDFIKRVRAKSKYTQQELATALGVERTTIYYWEIEKRTPSLKNQRKIDEFAKTIK